MTPPSSPSSSMSSASPTSAAHALRALTLSMGLMSLMGCSHAEAPSPGPWTGLARGAAPPREPSADDLKVWPGAPHHLWGRALIPLYRGASSSLSYDALATDLTLSSSMSSTNKLRWSKAASAALINYVVPSQDPSSPARPLFARAPAGIAQIVFMRPVQQAGPADDAAQAKPASPPAPSLHTPAPRPSPVATILPHWELPGLSQPRVLASVVLDETPPDSPSGSPRRYRSALWIKAPEADSPLYEHRDAQLEPASWQLRPDGSAMIEVVMVDSRGWPKRIDLIDLSALTSRALLSVE